nr:oligosaccharide flippase family protein [Lachnoclostridium phocaeense]
MKKNKVLIATKWSMISEVIAKVISPITTMILARLLSTEVFGIVASITAITSLADLLTDAGFNAYIVQHQFKSEIEKKNTFNVCFWSNFIISSVLFWVIVINRNTFSALVGAQGFEKALIVASLVLPLTSISSIEQAIMKKELRFKEVGLIKVISKIVPLVSTIPLALSGMEYWSLIIGTLIGELVNVILCLKIGSFLPSFYYSFAYLKKISSFSLWAFMESILEWLIANIAILFLGSLYGIYYLGVFKTGINIISQITTSVYALYSNVYKSAIAKEQSNAQSFKQIFYTFQRYTSIISIPLGVGVFLYRNLVTDILLGSKWYESITLIGLWGLTAMISIAFGNFYSDAIRAKGYPQKLVFIDLIYLATIILILMNTENMNFQEFCIYFSLAKIIQPVLQIFWGQKICNIRFLSVLSNCYPQLIATGVMATIVIIFNFTKYDNLIQIVTVFISIIVYFIILVCIHPERKLLIKYFQELMHRG